MLLAFSKIVWLLRCRYPFCCKEVGLWNIYYKHFMMNCCLLRKSSKVELYYSIFWLIRNFLTLFPESLFTILVISLKNVHASFFAFAKWTILKEVESFFKIIKYWNPARDWVDIFPNVSPGALKLIEATVYILGVLFRVLFGILMEYLT
jgi:hypothetical protein